MLLNEFLKKYLHFICICIETRIILNSKTLQYKPFIVDTLYIVCIHIGVLYYL